MLTQSHLIHYHTNRPDVAGIGVVLAVQAFRRHIAEGTSVSTCNLRVVVPTQFFTDAEVRQLSSSQLGIYENVVWLDVTMQLLPLSVEVLNSM